MDEQKTMEQIHDLLPQLDAAEKMILLSYMSGFLDAKTAASAKN